MHVEVRETPFDPWAALQSYQQEQGQMHGQFGATAVFVGTMRDFNEGDGVTGMSLEHYPGMTERHLERICEEAAGRWQLLDTLLVHRVGGIVPGEPIVLVVVWSVHRRDAFEACRFIMEDLKSRAPFWKKETLYDNDTRWVDKNTDGY